MKVILQREIAISGLSKNEISSKLNNLIKNFGRCFR
jgi:hypothetical protein